MANFYGTVNGGDQFFSNRLHKFDWVNATPDDKQAALVQATELIDQFNYVGEKYAVAILADDATEEQKRVAALTQPLEFPRGTVNTVPTEIENACYLIAKALLGGRDPELDLEQVAVSSEAYGPVRSSYDRTGNQQQHIAHLIPSPQAFNLLLPFMREKSFFQTKRV